MRIRSSTIFRENPDGSLTTLYPVRVGSAQFGTNVTVSGNVKLGPLSIGTLRDKEVEADKKNGVYIINGYYELE